MNKKGYSLIELLAVIIIVGLIVIVAIPAVSRILTSNDEKEYSNYFMVVESSAKAYADDKKDDLGSSNDTGCIEVSLDDLIKEEYVKEFDSDEVTCSGDVRLNNNKGNLKININLTCVNDKGKETFKKENIGEEACIAYAPKDDDGLRSKIINNGVGSGTTAVYSNKTYIRGSNPNNYVWYSGKIWRVVYYDNYSIKLISNDIITVMTKNDNSAISYKNSLISKWLNNTFLPSLKNYNNYLIDTIWDTSSTSSPTFSPSGSETVTSKVGLLNSYEASRMGSYLGSNYKWLLSNYYNNKVRVSTKSGSGNIKEEDFSYTKYYAIRPAITMKSDVYVISGDGSQNNPYILEGNSTNIPKGTLINTRVSGEYLKINDNVYRIVSTSNNLTKVIMVDSLAEMQYSNNNSHNYSYSNVYEYLKNDWYNSLGDDKKLIYENASWCHKTISKPVLYSLNCEGDTITSPVGIPVLGDLYTANNDGNKDVFWTINPYSTNGEPSMNVISNDTVIDSKVSTSQKVKPVMYLKENVIINSGEGTKDNPFILGLK